MDNIFDVRLRHYKYVPRSQKASLFGVINRTQTEVGAQALKRNLLGKPKDYDINFPQECVLHKS